MRAPQCEFRNRAIRGANVLKRRSIQSARRCPSNQSTDRRILAGEVQANLRPRRALTVREVLPVRLEIAKREYD
jgi:hypothetical protein